MAYPPPPYKDAVCGTHVAGEAIVGKWWAYPPQPGLLLGGYPPALLVLSGDQVPTAGLKLGAFVPVGAGQLYVVPAAGLKLGGYLPAVSLGATLTVPPAGLILGGRLPTLRLSTTLVVTPAGLLLGAHLPEGVGAVWLLPLDCLPLLLAADPEQDLALVATAAIEIDLDPVECL